MGRLIAFILLVIPALICAAGIKFMRDTLYASLIEPFPWLWLQFITGLAMFLFGFFFFAGFLLNRDRKAGKVSKRWQKKAN